MDTVMKLNSYFVAKDIRIKVVGVPKTIDNDVTETDHTPGFGSAAKYVACSLQEIIRDSRVYSIPSVTIVEIMGQRRRLAGGELLRTTRERRTRSAPDLSPGGRVLPGEVPRGRT